MVTPEEEQPFASVQMTVYVPAGRLVGFTGPKLFSQEYVYPGVPPAPVAATDPSFKPLQVTFVLLAVTVSMLGWLTPMLFDVEQPLASVTVQRYVFG